MPDFAVTLKRTYHFKDAYNAHSAQERAIDHANHASIAGYGGSWREEHVESVVNVNALPKTTTFTLTQDEIDVVARALACSYREHRGRRRSMRSCRRLMSTKSHAKNAT